MQHPITYSCNNSDDNNENNNNNYNNDIKNKNNNNHKQNINQQQQQQQQQDQQCQRPPSLILRLHVFTMESPPLSAESHKSVFNLAGTMYYWQKSESLKDNYFTDIIPSNDVFHERFFNFFFCVCATV